MHGGGEGLPLLVTLLLIEDDAACARTVVRGLSTRGYSVLVAPSVQTARQHVHRGDIELILLDRGLPDGDGIEFCAAVRREGLAIPILILTGRDELNDQLAGYRAGADEYVVKPAHLDLLCAKIDAHLRAKPSGRRTIGPITIDENKALVFVEGRRVRVTPTEYAILSTLALHVDQPIDRDHLAAIVWGESWKLECGTLYTNISRLRTKLGEAAAAHFCTLGRGQGWVLRSQSGGEPVSEAPSPSRNPQTKSAGAACQTKSATLASNSAIRVRRA